MKAILLAAGFGKRLMPLTNETPKCLVKIRNEELLGLWIKKLKNININEILINTHHLAEKVAKYVEENFSDLDNIVLKKEKKLLGTAGTLQANLKFFEGKDGLLIHADNYSKINLGQLIMAHQNRPKECDITMLVFRTKTPESCGIVDVNSRGIVQGFYEKKKTYHGDLANGAVYILSNKCLEELEQTAEKYEDFSMEVIPKFIGRIFVHETNEVHLDIGTPSALMEAQKL